MASQTRQIDVVRIIARLNIGGPSIQALTLTDRLHAFGYTTTLIRGREGEREGNMDYLAEQLGVQPVLVSALRRDPGWHDAVALLNLTRITRRCRPHIVHTHAAKAGTLGRLATLASSTGRARPILVHTYHGHSLSGYFSPTKTAGYFNIERVLARRTDRLIAVSEQVRDELVDLGVAEPERFEVIPLGFDLSPFTLAGDERAAGRRRLREELDIPAEATVVTLVARLVPIKRIDRFLRAAATLTSIPEIQFLVVGDGELRESLECSPEARRLGARLTWTGFRRDMPMVYFASDIAVLCSDNEGTPVSLIEAAAAGLPTISTRVGGAAKVVLDQHTGILVGRDDERRLSEGLARLVADESMRARMGAAGRHHALRTFSLDRLVREHDDLYLRLLADRDARHVRA